jgi:hypothetical protein
MDRDLDSTHIEEQKKWIATHGGDLEGYRRNYKAHVMIGMKNPYERIDEIYYADVNHLRRLQGHPEFLIHEDEVKRLLGESYFA